MKEIPFYKEIVTHLIHCVYLNMQSPRNSECFTHQSFVCILQDGR